MFETVFTVFDKLYNNFFLWKRRIQKGNNLFIQGKCHISGNIKLGNDVCINSGWVYNPIGGQERTVLMTLAEGKMNIGNNVGISNSTLIAREYIEVGDNVKIGGSCKIYDNDFHSLNYFERNEIIDTNIKSAPVIIKKGAFIGAHCIILKGVTIGEQSIIGAGSVVTRNVPDGEIWAGNPARCVRKIGM